LEVLEQIKSVFASSQERLA